MYVINNVLLPKWYKAFNYKKSDNVLNKVEIGLFNF